MIKGVVEKDIRSAYFGGSVMVLEKGKEINAGFGYDMNSQYPNAMLHYIPLCYTMLHYVTLCYTMFHYVPLCYTMFHYGTEYAYLDPYINNWKRVR